jgi:glycosyltransferase involved in cell wall biosynthesis
VIITKFLPPEICGLGDHSVMLGDAIRLRGHKVTLVGGSGAPRDDRLIVEDFWRNSGFGLLMRKLESIGVDHLILQFTPLTYTDHGKHQSTALIDFWHSCSRKWKTSLILHETYFRVWWYPPSIINGAIEKRIIKAMVRKSHYVFTASQPLFDEVKNWHCKPTVFFLPIGSNVIFCLADRQGMRLKAGIRQEDVALTLFGGGENLRRLKHYVEIVDAFLSRNGVPVCWILLGGIKKDWFSLTRPVFSPGFLPPEDLSAWLQMTDIFLMPHISGLCAKRGTLIAALQHGLPVVGTKGRMTDRFWEDAQGVVLTSIPGARRFANAVLNLSTDADWRSECGRLNRLYFEQHFTWDKIAEAFLGHIG